MLHISILILTQAADCYRCSTSLFATVCWGGGIRSYGENNLNKLVRKASSVVGMEVDSVEAVTEKRLRRKLEAIMESPSYLFYADPGTLHTCR